MRSKHLPAALQVAPMSSAMIAIGESLEDALPTLTPEERWKATIDIVATLHSKNLLRV